MNEKEKKFSFKWLDKLKNVKHIEIYIAIIFIVVVLLIYMSTVKNKSPTSSYSKDKTTTEELTITAYIDDLEQNLESILSNIGGVSNVKVLITLNMEEAEVVDSKINLNKFPSIKGVIVTASGAENTATKMKILHAVESVIDVNNGNIQILSSN